MKVAELSPTASAGERIKSCTLGRPRIQSGEAALDDQRRTGL